EVQKPLFGIFFRFSMTRLFPVIALLSKLHLVAVGPLLIRPLDSRVLRKSGTKLNARKAVGAILLFNLLLFLGLHFKNVQDLYKEPELLLVNLGRIFILFAVTIVPYFHYIILHYFQYTTLVALI